MPRFLEARLLNIIDSFTSCCKATTECVDGARAVSPARLGLCLLYMPHLFISVPLHSLVTVFFCVCPYSACLLLAQSVRRLHLIHLAKVFPAGPRAHRPTREYIFLGGALLASTRGAWRRSRGPAMAEEENGFQVI